MNHTVYPSWSHFWAAHSVSSEGQRLSYYFIGSEWVLCYELASGGHCLSQMGLFMRQVEGTISTALKTFVTRCSVSPRFKHLFQDERRFRLSSSLPALTSLRMSHLLCIIRWRQNSLSEQQKRDHCLKNVAFKGIAFLFGCHFFRDFKTDVTQNKIQSEIFARECHWSQPLVLCVCRNERLHSQLYYTSFFLFFFSCAQAYTSQFVALVMFALMMCADRISMQPRRRAIIQDLKVLPGKSKVLLCWHVQLFINRYIWKSSFIVCKIWQF